MFGKTSGLSTIVIAIVAVVVIAGLGGAIFFVGPSLSSEPENVAIALSGLLQDTSGGAGTIGLMIRNTGNVAISIDGTDPNFLTISGRGTPGMTITQPNTVVTLKPGDSITIQADATGVQIGGQYTIIVTFQH